MATTTTYYGLTKPDSSDFYDVSVFNDNADILDTQLKDTADTAAAAAAALEGRFPVSVADGGTGQTTEAAAANAFVNALDTESTTPQDADYVVAQTAGGGTTTTTYKRKPLSALFNYIKGKLTGAISTVLTSNLTAARAVATNSSGKLAVSSVTTGELGRLSGVTSNVQNQLDSKQATITGAATTIASSDLTASRALVSDSDGKVAVSAVTATELGYLDGVTSKVQTQLNKKQATISGAATTITSSNLTASRALISDSSGKVAVSAVTSTELGYLDGVTSNVQTQLDAKLESGDLSGLLLTKNHTTDSMTAAQNATTEFSYTVPTVSGYTVMLVLPPSLHGSASLSVCSYNYSASTKVLTFTVNNPAEISKTFYATVTCLLVSNG